VFAKLPKDHNHYVLHGEVWNVDFRVL